MKLLQQFKNPIEEESIVLLCVIRDEELLLPAFIHHYNDLRVTHFVFIDNGSIDGSLEYLLSQSDLDIQIWSTKDSYAKNGYGTRWVREVMDLHCKGKWCLIVDIDEFLLLKDDQKLPEIQKKMIKQGSNILTACLVDFYPKEFEKEEYKKNSPPLGHSNYYDKYNHNFYNIRVWENFYTTVRGGSRYRMIHYKSLSSSSPIKKMLRYLLLSMYKVVFLRLKYINNKLIQYLNKVVRSLPDIFWDEFCLSKKLFLKYDFYNTHYVGEGVHNILANNSNTILSPVRYLKPYREVILVGHFKFIKPNLRSFFRTRINRKQDWRDGIEYTKYLSLMGKSVYQNGISKKYTNVSDLYDDFKILNKLNAVHNKFSF